MFKNGTKISAVRCGNQAEKTREVVSYLDHDAYPTTFWGMTEAGEIYMYVLEGAVVLEPTVAIE